MAILRALGRIGIDRFLREYWQRRPLLVRNAIPDLVPPVDRRHLFGLAAREDVESRLVSRFNGIWRLKHGPFTRRALPPLSTGGWTLLVQGADLADPHARELLERFRFLPDARLDDLMVSFATDGGGIPAHVDNYDVFLIQTHGQRRWQVSRQRDQRLQPGLPVRLLADFRPTHDWVLQPGDVLYLPPGVAHKGTAIGECITCSVGFRTPTWQELIDPWFARYAEQVVLPGRYADPGQRRSRHPGALPDAMVAQVHRVLSRARPSRRDTARFLLEYLTEPKAVVVFSPRHKPTGFIRAARRDGVVLDLRSRLLIGAAGAGCNGEFVPMVRGHRRLLERLADQRNLSGAEIAAANPALIDLLGEWYAAGWLHVADRKHR